jgi:hypothetical protein
VLVTDRCALTADEVVQLALENWAMEVCVRRRTRLRGWRCAGEAQPHGGLCRSGWHEWCRG